MSEYTNKLPLANPAEWSRFVPSWRAVGRCATLAAAGAALATGVGTTVFPVESQLGPNRVEATFNAHNEGVLDLGFIGSFVKHDLGPLPIGVTVEVKEIPYTGKDLGINDVMSYASFFDTAGRESAFHDLQDAFLDRMKTTGKWGFAGGLILGAALSTRRRRPMEATVPGRAVQPSRMRLAVACSTAATMTLGGAMAIPQPELPPGNPTLEAIGISDVEVRGAPLIMAIDKYAYVAKTLNELDEYYGRVGDKTMQQYDQVITAEKADPTSALNRFADQAVRLVAIKSDMHCNTYQAIQVGRLADHIGAKEILDIGDETVSGYPFEKRCVEAIIRHTKAKEIKVTGNHDSPDVTAQQGRDAGNTVLNDEKVVVNGIRFLGGPDRNRSLIGQGTHQIGEQSNAQHGEQLAKMACEGEQPDIAIVHDPTAAQEITRTGCVPLVIAGHEHRYRRLTVTTEQGISQLVVMGSTGGAPADGEAKVTIANRLTEEAHMAVVALGPNNEPLYIRNIFIAPKGKDDVAVRVETELFPPQQPQLNPSLVAAGPN